MKRIEEFRKYYNHTIHPELMRMERRRLRLLRLLLFSTLLLFGLLLFELYLNLLALTLLLSIPVGLYMTYLFYQVQQFRLTFKPNVMNLILDFIDDGLNFDPATPLRYDAQKGMAKERFLESGIFATDAPVYHGEDYIAGKIGSMYFEMSELFVKDFSEVRPGLQHVFQGVFMHATFPEKAEGRIIVWPRRLRNQHFRAIHNFTWLDGDNADHEIMNDEFREAFITYADSETHVIATLSEPMQDALVEYRNASGKEIYLSFNDQDIYAAVTEDKDMLEPHLFRSNLSFELVREFFEDIHLLLRIAEDFDQTH